MTANLLSATTIMMIGLVMSTTTSSAFVVVSTTKTTLRIANTQSTTTPIATTTTSSASTICRPMGLFDFIENAFQNEEFDDRRVTASHILFDSEEEALVVLKDLRDDENTLTFTQAASNYSKCPSSKDGGSLGTFEPGSMVKEFEDLVFDELKSPIGEIVGPLQTQFGYHLVLVENRFLNQDRSDGSGVF